MFNVDIAFLGYSHTPHLSFLDFYNLKYDAVQSNPTHPLTASQQFRNRNSYNFDDYGHVDLDGDVYADIEDESGHVDGDWNAKVIEVGQELLKSSQREITYKF